jgi:hypothetical protein
MGQLFFAPFDQSERTAFVFAARVGYLRAGARVVSHEAFNQSPRFWRIGRVLSICPIIGNSIGNCATAVDACQDG